MTVKPDPRPPRPGAPSRALGVLLLALSALLAAPEAEASRRYALIIGANQGGPSHERLRYAEADADRMAHILRDVGGFEPTDVFVLTRTDAASVRKALIDVNARIRQERGSSMLFVYYSGHGDAGALHITGTRFDLQELKNLVSGSPASSRVLVIDSCQSGAITRIKGGTPAPAFDIAFERGKAEGLAILTSSAASEDSQESDALGASIFTHYLASALLGAADRNGDGLVTLGEAFSYASERTLAASSSTVAGPQHPTYRYDLGGRDDLVLTRPSTGRRMGVLTFPGAGVWLVSQGGPHGAVVAEVVTEASGVRLALRPGNYAVTRRERDHLLQGEVQIREGESTRLAPGGLRRIDYARVVRKGGTERTVSTSLYGMAGLRGDILGLGVGVGGGIGLRLDFPVLSLEGRFGMLHASTRNERLLISTREIALSALLTHAVDLGPFTLGGGIEGGAMHVGQDFHERQTPARSSYALNMGPVAQVELPLGGAVSLRAEGALLTYFLPGGREFETPITFRLGAGMGVSF